MALSALMPPVGLVSLALALGLASLPQVVEAQQSPGLYWLCQPISATQPVAGYCPVSNAYPLPQGPAINALQAVSGAQTSITITSSTNMTIPATATVALVQASGTNNAVGQCLIWRDDGTAASSTAGVSLAVGASMWVKPSTTLKMIQANGATCSAAVSYYK